MPKGASRAAGRVFSSGTIKSVATWVDALTEEIPGIVMFSGNSLTMSSICSALVLEM